MITPTSQAYAGPQKFPSLPWKTTDACPDARKRGIIRAQALGVPPCRLAPMSSPGESCISARILASDRLAPSSRPLSAIHHPSLGKLLAAN